MAEEDNKNEKEIIIMNSDSEYSDVDESTSKLKDVVKKMFPGISSNAIKTYEDEDDDEDDDDDETDYEDDIDLENIDWENFKFNIVLSLDELGLDNLPEEEDDYDSLEDYTTDENEVIEDYEKPLTRSHKKNKKTLRERAKKNSITPKKDQVQSEISSKREIVNSTKKKKKEKTTTKEEKSKHKKEITADGAAESLIDKMINAKSEGDDNFIKLCNEMVAQKKEEIAKKRKLKQEKENKKCKEENSKEFRKLLRGQQYSSELKYFNKMPVEEQREILEKFKDINEKSKIEVPYKISLINSNIPSDFKVHAIKKISSLEYMDQSSGEYYKIKQWIDTFMKIPFGKYTSLPIQMNKSSPTEIQEYMEQSIEQLNNIVYGLDDAKYQIIQMIGQWISNPKSIGNAIAIKGPMGTGKTTLVKEGVSKILNRPFAFIALGGATDSSFLEGHSYTYEGSIWGKIVDILIQSKCMNPVIYFDELDKISDTPRGEEIVGILTHLTDASQNDQFHDKYFSGIDFDLSRALFIFSYNDEDKVNSILKDRMYHIETKGYDNTEKNIIANKYLLPKIRENVLFEEGNIVIEDDVLEYINNTFTKKEKGVRNLKRCLEIIHTKVNLYRLLKPETALFNSETSLKIEFPFKITKEHIDKFIKINEGNEPPFIMYT
jgi:ATP-dependent Lon protease